LDSDSAGGVRAVRWQTPDDPTVVDAVTGALVQRFSDHPAAASADGTRLFGAGGAVFCR
jgi:hypothetical protein